MPPKRNNSDSKLKNEKKKKEEKPNNYATFLLLKRKLTKPDETPDFSSNAIGSLQNVIDAVLKAFLERANAVSKSNKRRSIIGSDIPEFHSVVGQVGSMESGNNYHSHSINTFDDSMFCRLLNV